MSSISSQILISPTSLQGNIQGTITVTYQEPVVIFGSTIWINKNLNPDTLYILRYSEGLEYIDISSNTTSSNPGAEIDFFVSSVNMPPAGDYLNQISLWSRGLTESYLALHSGLFSVIASTNFVISQGTGIKSLNSIISANCPVFDNDANLHMNGKNILGINNLGVTNLVDVGTATTFNSNQLVPQRVLYARADANIPNITDDGCRFVAINTKNPSSPEWNYGTGEPITYQQIRQNVTASALYDELLWVGTDHGQIFYYDAGTWTRLDTNPDPDPALSRINCLQVYGNGRYLAVGGKFGTPAYSIYHCMYAIHKDNGTYLPIQISSNNVTGGVAGDEVKCFYDNALYQCLYIGGKFSFDLSGSGSATSTSFITFKYDTKTLYNVFDNNNIGDNGFYDLSSGDPGTVNSISVDSDNRIFVGGNFDIVYRAVVSVTNSTPYLFIWSSLDGKSYTDNISIVGGVQFDGPVSSLLEYGTGQMLIGGSFTVPINKGMVAKWNLAGAQYGISEYPLISGGATSDITFIQQPYIGSDIFTALTNILYRSSNITIPMVSAIEVESWNCVAYNGTFLFASNITQNPLKDNTTVIDRPETETDVSVIRLSGSGSGAKVNLTMDLSSNTVTRIDITTTGNNYAVGDSIRIETTNGRVEKSLNFFEAVVLNGTLEDFYFHTYTYPQGQVSLTSSNPIITSSSSSSIVTLLIFNSYVELIWNNTLSSWYILSQQGASFS